MNKEDVRYSFTGDVSSLRAATEKAIGLLDKYSSAMANASSKGQFQASQKSMNSFKASLNRMQKDIDSVVKKMQGLSDIPMPKTSGIGKALGDAVKVITSQLDKFDSSTKITSSVLAQMKQALDGADQGIKKSTTDVDRLVQSERKFQTTLSGIQTKMTMVQSLTTNFGSKAVRMMIPVIAKFTRFGQLFDIITPKINSLRAVAATAFNRMSAVLQTVSAAFRRTAKSTDSDTNAENKNTSATRKNTQAQTNLTKGLMQVNTYANKVRGSIVTLSTRFTGLNQVVNLASTSMRALASVQVHDWLAKASKASIDYVETLNLFNVAMGSSIDIANEYIDKMSEIYGMDPNTLMNTAGVFYLLEDAIAMPSEAAAKMALSLTKAANDVASLYNMSIDKVTQDFQSGMQGMTRAVRKYGFDVRITTLQQKALELGLRMNVATTTEANRQALRYIVMMEQMHKSTKQTGVDVNGAAAAMGDFANTIESPANQLRIFKEQLIQLGRAIGNYIVYPLSKAIAYINGFVMAIRTALNYLASLLGIVDMFGSFGTSKAADAAYKSAAGIGAMGDAAKGAAKDMKALLAPFDELNVLSQDMGSGGGSDAMLPDEVIDPALLQAMDEMYLGLEDIQMKANKVRDSLLAAFGFTYSPEGEIVWSKDLFKDSLEQMFPEWSKTIEDAFKRWDTESIGQIIGVMISGSMTKFADWISWDRVSTEVTKVIGTFSTIFNAAVETMDAGEVGRAIGELVNTISQTVYQLFSSIKWDTLGTRLGEGLTGAIAAIDWQVLGATLTRIPVVVITMLGTAFASADWELVATSLVAGVKSAIMSLIETITTYGPDIILGATTLVTNLVTGILQALPDLVAAGLEMIGALLEGLVEAIPTIVESIPEITAAITDTLLTALPTLVDVGFELLNALIESLPEVLLGIIDAAGQIIGQLVSTIIAAIPTIIRAGIELFIALIGALPEIIITIVDAIPQIIIGIVDGFVDNIDKIIEAGVQLFISLIAALPRIIATIITAIPEIIAGIIQAFRDNFYQIVDIGRNLIEGLWDGINGAKDWIKDKVSGWAGDFVDGVKDFFGIHSPSKVFASMGDYVVQGFAQGMTETQAATQASERMMNEVLRVAKNFCDKLATTMRTSFDTMLTNLLNFATKYLNGMKMLSNQILNAYESLWAAVMDVTTQAQDSLQHKLDQMVSAAQRAAREIASAVKAASQAAASMPSISATTTTTTKTTTSASEKIAKMATGGVVTSPTLAWVGEAGHSEAVIPLDNSPQMAELIDKIVAATSKQETASSTPVEVKVYIGQDEFDAYTYKASQKGQRIVGRQPITIGG